MGNTVSIVGNTEAAQRMKKQQERTAVRDEKQQ